MSKADPARHAPDEIDAYLEALPEAYRSALARVRGIIKEIAPECTERVSYGIPIFRQRVDLVGISARQNHCALHSMSPQLMATMAEDFKDVKVSGATIHFTPERPLSRELIEKIVRQRMKEADLSR